MSGDFRPVPLTKLPIDAFKHVRYVDGMVLGVDDFEQEFAYLSERDKLLVRMLAGYGTVRGLRVFMRNAGTADVEVAVSAGLGITPSGDVVRVPVDQCAKLKEWIEGSGVETPGAGDERRLVAYLTAEYASKTSDPVPIPGEPCRTEDQVQADSRVADSFRLELSVVAPEQPEEAAGTAYLKWLESLNSVETGGTGVNDLTRGILRAAWETTDGSAGAPPAAAPPDEPLVFGSSPRGPGGASIALNRKERLIAFLAGLEKLADVRALSAVLGGTVTGDLPQTGSVRHTKLLLAKLSIPVVRAAIGSDVFLPKTGAGSDVEIDDSQAPRLLSLRYLLRAVHAGLSRVARSAVTVAPAAPTSAAASRRYVVAAAGAVTVAPNEGGAASAMGASGSIGGLRAWAGAGNTVFVDFEGLGIPSDRYVVKAFAKRQGAVNPVVTLIDFDGTDTSRFTLSVTGPANPAGVVLHIEVGAIVD